MSFRDEPLRRLNEYVKRNRLALGKELGFGVHGIVYTAKGQSAEGVIAPPSAIKAHEREVEYTDAIRVFLVSPKRERRVARPFACASG